MKTVVVSFEGVCVPDDGSPLFERLPVPGSLMLLTTLSSQYNIIVHSDIRVPGASPLLKAWLRQQSFPDSELMYRSSGGIEGIVKAARRRGYDVELVLDANPLNVAECVKLGVQALLVVSPSYMRPDFRPDFESEIRPWDAMVETIDAVREQRNADSRFEVVEP